MSKRLMLMALVTMAIILPQQASAECGCRKGEKGDSYRGDRRRSPHVIEDTAHRARKEQKETSKRARRAQERRERKQDMNTQIDVLHSRINEMEDLLHDVADLMVSNEQAQ